MAQTANQVAGAHYPERVPIDAYGNGGFRFADISHRGPLLALPSGMHAWNDLSGVKAEALQPTCFQVVFAEADRFQFLLLGTGAEHIFANADLQQAFAEHTIGLETMSTGAACRTYNILLGEGRPVAAALVAVD